MVEAAKAIEDRDARLEVRRVTVMPARLLMAAMGLFGGLGHFTLIKAFEAAPAPVITPFGYTSIVWATILGLVVFGDLPDLATFAGAGLIIASGLYVFHRERQAEQRAKAARA